MNPENFFAGIAATLDSYANLDGDSLWELVFRRGACMRPDFNDELPDFASEDEDERLAALRICSSCPVRWECLELDLRTSGAEPSGVWGGFGPEDRSAIHEYWVARRRQAAGGAHRSSIRGEHEADGGQRT